jgi:hypothetical protein
MKGVFTCPDDMDPAAQDLLHGLMQKDVSKRIGRLANGADDMRNHEWYSKAGFDWVGCRSACLPACLPAALARVCGCISPFGRLCACRGCTAAAAVPKNGAAFHPSRWRRRRHVVLRCRGRLGRGGPGRVARSGEETDRQRRPKPLRGLLGFLSPVQLSAPTGRAVVSDNAGT